MATSQSGEKANIRLYLADDFRQEPDQKVSAIGLYADQVIVVNLRPGAPPPSANSPVAIPVVSLLITISGLKGSHEIGIDYKDPFAVKKSYFEKKTKLIDFSDRPSAANIFLKFESFTTSGAGIKQIIVSIDGKKTKREFEVRFENLPG
jgi:hypothetical protein